MANANNVFIGSGYLYMNEKAGYKAGEGDSHYRDFMWNIKLRIRRTFKNAQGEYDSDFLPMKISGPSAYYVHNNLKNGDPIVVMGELRMDGEIKNEDTGEITRYASPVIFADNVNRAPGNFANNEGSNSSSDDAPARPAFNKAVTSKKPSFDTSKFKMMKRA